MALHILKPSFAGGELAPALYGRTDLQKYDVGAAVLENMIVLRYGGVSRRPGFRYIAQTHNNRKARLIPFRYSVGQNYAIEVTAGAFRFYTKGGILVKNGAPYVVGNPFTEPELATIKYAQSADTLFLVQPNHAPITLTRYGITDWRVATMEIGGGPFEDPKTTGIKIGASARTGMVTLIANGNYFTADMVGGLLQLGHTIPSQRKKGIPGTDDLTVECAPKSTVYVESFGFWDGDFSLEKESAKVNAFVKIRTQDGNRSQNYQLTDTNDTDEIVTYRVTSTHFDTSVWTNENEKQRGFMTIQAFAQDYYGIVKITGVVSGTQATGVVLRKLYLTAPTGDFSISPWSPGKGYPGAVGFFEDRLIFAGSRHYPQTYWASKSGDYYNFGVSIPQTDNDAVTGTLNNGQMNGVKAVITFAEMLLQTAGGTYKVSGGNEPLSYKNQQSKPQEYRGINDLMPVVVGNRIVFVQQMGNIVRDIGYSYDVDKYTGDDVSLLAEHLFSGHVITGITYQQVPNSIVWCVRDDGILLGMTYIKEQELYAWHHHTTQGQFVDVCSISGGAEDELYAVIKRGTNYYVEVMGPQTQTKEAVGVYHVDNGLTVENNTNTVIEGLSWLNGKAVQVLADGNVLPEQTVMEGRITLKRAYRTLHIGLAYDSILKTLPIEFNGGDGSYADQKKRVSRLMVMFKDCRGGMLGVSENAMDEIKWRSTEPYGEPIQLFSGKKYITLPRASFEDTQYVIIKQSDPLPMNILSIVPEVVPGG